MGILRDSGAIDDSEILHSQIQTASIIAFSCWISIKGKISNASLIMDLDADLYRNEFKRNTIKDFQDLVEQNLDVLIDQGEDFTEEEGEEFIQEAIDFYKSCIHILRQIFPMIRSNDDGPDEIVFRKDCQSIIDWKIDLRFCFRYPSV